MSIRITIQIKESLKQQIDAYIKRKYPEVKTISQVVREALKRFLEAPPNESKQ